MEFNDAHNNFLTSSPSWKTCVSAIWLYFIFVRFFLFLLISWITTRFCGEQKSIRRLMKPTLRVKHVRYHSTLWNICWSYFYYLFCIVGLLVLVRYTFCASQGSCL